jgi:NTE family protein
MTDTSPAKLRASPFLRGLPEAWLAELAARMRTAHVAPGTPLTVVGERVERLTLVLSGEVGHEVGDAAHPELVIDEGVGVMLGLGVVAAGAPVESATTRAVAPLEIGWWDAQTLDEIEARAAPGLRAQLAVRLSLRGRSKELVRGLRQTRLFQGVSPALLRRLLTRATLARFAAGEPICREGEPGDVLFHLVAGEVRLLQQAGRARAEELGTLYTGSSFGEAALLTGAPRNATVTALRDCEVLLLGRVDVDAVARESRAFREALRAIADERTMGGAPKRAPKVTWLVNRTPFSTESLARLLAASLTRDFGARVLLAPLEPNGEFALESEVEGVARIRLARARGDGVRVALDGAIASHRAEFVIAYCDPAHGGCADDAVEGTYLAEAASSALLLSLDGAAPFPHPFWKKDVAHAHVRTARFAASARNARREAVRLRLDLAPDRLAPSLDEASAAVRAAFARLGRAVAHCEVGVALSGGAAWGYAHLALLRGLLRDRIPIDVIAGVSFGSLTGALFASRGAGGLDALEGHCRELAMVAAAAPVSSRLIGRFATRHLAHATLEELDTAFFPIAVDIESGRERVFRTGPIAPAVRASCSLPGIFGPTLYDGTRYVDGCVTNNVPTGCLIDEGADFLIASNIVPAPRHRAAASTRTKIRRFNEELSPIGRVRDTARALFLLFSVVGNQQAADADVTFSPSLDFLPTDFTKARAIVAHAEAQVEPVLAQIRQRYRALCRGAKGEA